MNGDPKWCICIGTTKTRGKKKKRALKTMTTAKKKKRKEQQRQQQKISSVKVQCDEETVVFLQERNQKGFSKENLQVYVRTYIHAIYMGRHAFFRLPVFKGENIRQITSMA